MYNAEYVDLLKNNEVHNIDVVIEFMDSDIPDLHNEDILDGEFHIEKSICSGDAMRFGTVTASELTFSLMYSDRKYIGQKIRVYMYLNDDPMKNIPIGIYTIDSDVPDGSRETVEITAHDVLWELQNRNVQDWYANLTYPITMKEFRDLLFENVGLEQNQTSLVNDSMYIYQTIDSDFIPATELIKAICEANAVFGMIDREGNFEYVKLNTGNPIQVTEDIYYDVTYENYETDVITGVVIRQEENDIGGRVGTDDNAYIIENNFLFYGKSSQDLREAAQNIFNSISGISFVPFNMEMWNITVDPGDCLSIHTVFDEVISTFAFNVSTSGILDMEDVITNNVKKEQSTNAGGIMSDIKQLRGKANVLERSVEETKSQITDVERGLTSKITQTAEELNVQISEIQNELDGNISVYTVDETPTLLNEPAWNFTYNIPCNNTVHLAEDLMFEYTDAYYKKNARSIAFDMNAGITYRFSKQDGAWGWVPTADTEYSYILEQISELKVTSGEISSSVQSLSLDVKNNYVTTTAAQSMIQQTSQSIIQTVSADYVTKDLANSSYETKVHSQSEIKQLSDSISLKVTKGNVSSEISQEAGKIKITSNRFALESTNCTISEDGKIVAKSIDIRGGSINMDTNKQNYDIIRLNFGNVGTYVGSLGITCGNVSTYGTYSSMNDTGFTIRQNGTIVTQLSSAVGNIFNEIKVGNGSSNIVDVKNDDVSVIYDISNKSDLKYTGLEIKKGYDTTYYNYDSIKFYNGTFKIISTTTDRIVADSNGVNLTGNIKMGTNNSSRLGFFGSTGETRKTVNKLSSTANLSTVVSKVNDLLTALRDYGLIASS